MYLSIRKGSVVSTVPSSEANEKKLASLMVGKEITNVSIGSRGIPDDVVFSMKRVTVLHRSSLKVLDDVSFDIRKGEIFGIAGVQGNGQTELAEAVTGLRRIFKGEMEISGKQISGLSPSGLIDIGVGHIPEDRLKHGVVLSYPVCDNQILNTYRSRPFSLCGVLKKSRIIENAERLIEKFDIKTKGFQKS